MFLHVGVCACENRRPQRPTMSHPLQLESQAVFLSSRNTNLILSHFLLLQKTEAHAGWLREGALKRGPGTGSGVNVFPQLL